MNLKDTKNILLMQALINLREDDFSLESGSKGPIMCSGISGLSLVMFWSPKSPGSMMLLPGYKQLPQIIPSCKFCVLNLNENLGIISMSKQTVAPIVEVPCIILYNDGRPYLQYDDVLKVETIVEFVRYSKKLIETKKVFMNKGVKAETEIPKYCIASPYLDFSCKSDGFCYLEQGEAYQSKAPTLKGLGAANGGLYSVAANSGNANVMNQTTNSGYFQGK